MMIDLSILVILQSRPLRRSTPSWPITRRHFYFSAEKHSEGDMTYTVWCDRKFNPRHDSSDFSCDTDCVLMRSQSMQHYYFWVEDRYSFPCAEPKYVRATWHFPPLCLSFAVIGYMRPARADEAFGIGGQRENLC